MSAHPRRSDRWSGQEADRAAARRIAEAASGSDTEGNHIRADGILCDVLEGIGYVDTVNAFEEMEKWYE